MKKTLSFCGALLLALPSLSLATDYPLVFKTLDARQALSFPSGPTSYAMFGASKPDGIIKAPKAVSRYPLYGQLGTGTDQFLFRLDESKGTSQGYDRLIVDVNRNGDLTDDPVVSLIPSTDTPVVGSTPELIFGPIQAPDSLKIGDHRPVFFARVYVLIPVGSTPPINLNAMAGEIMVKPGWYLEATVDISGKQHKVDLVDGNCNFRLGDSARSTPYRTSVNGNDSSWTFQGGDRFLVDYPGSGTLASVVLQDQTCSFGPILYLDAKPYKATLASDCKSLALDPWTEPLAELSLQPHGDQVGSVQLGWEQTPGNWLLLKPGVENGKAKVPPGNYRLYSVCLKTKTASGDTLFMTGTRHDYAGSIKADAGATTDLQCGAPIQMDLTSQPTANQTQGFLGFSGSVEKAQSIQAAIVGAGGEVYSVPRILRDQGGVDEPPAPTFTIKTAEGKLVESGTLEYG